MTEFTAIPAAAEARLDSPPIAPPRNRRELEKYELETDQIVDRIWAEHFAETAQ